MGVQLALFHIYIALAVVDHIDGGGGRGPLQHGGGVVSARARVGGGTAPGRRLDPAGAAAGAAKGWAEDGVGDRSKLLAALNKRERAQDVRWRRGTDVGGGDGPMVAATEAGTVPIQYRLNVRLGSSVEATNPQFVAQLAATLANIVHIPISHVHVHSVQPEQHTLVMYFTKPGHSWHGNDLNDLLPASEVEDTLAKDQHTNLLLWLGVQDVFTQGSEILAVRSIDGTALQQPYFSYLMAGVTAAFVLLMILGSVMFYCWRRRKLEVTSGRSSPSPPPHLPVPQQICLYPVTKPDVQHATLIQPDITQIHTNKACGECGTPLHTPPLRLKKGLLERRFCRMTQDGRGSNASLTLDLGMGTPENKPTWGSPPRESCAEEYLLSAGNRMSRKQLRNCLRNVKLLYEEFWEIPMNHPDHVEVAGSGMKNRYRTIIPNEHTRVKMAEMDGDILTTYINANYIRGYGGEKRAYVATQGPMAHTVADFWRMIWQEKAPIIVMITKLKEKNKIKCEGYLPECGSLVCGDYEVHVADTQERDGSVIRQLTLKLDGKEHHVSHYWYTTWPDHKAPNTARQLLGLVKKVDEQRHRVIQPSGPVVVHCSAGIGRTGCFIATSIGMQQLREEHMVDVLGIVCTMRLDRGGMVQTNEQYEFVHQALCLYEKELPPKPPSGD